MDTNLANSAPGHTCHISEWIRCGIISVYKYNLNLTNTDNNQYVSKELADLTWNK